MELNCTQNIWRLVTMPTSTFTKHEARTIRIINKAGYKIKKKIGLNFFHSFLMQTRVVKPLRRLIISDANKKLKQSHLFKPYLLYGLSDFRYE